MKLVGPLAKSAAKYGAKYGPHAKVAWELGGKHLQAAARDRLDEMAVRRKAFDHASGTRAGSVLRVIDQDEVRYVVYSGDDPVAAYPKTDRPLAELVARADLAQRRTPEEHREQQVRARLRRAGATVRKAARRRRSGGGGEAGSGLTPAR